MKFGIFFFKKNNNNIFYVLNFQVKSEDGITPPESPNMYSPLFGISNAYFLSNGQNTNSQGNSNSEDNSPSKLVKDIPNLLSATQHPLSPSLLPNFPTFMNTNKSSNR